LPEFSPADVEFDDVCKTYGDRIAADHVSLNIRRGEFLAVLGPSGSGKSTLLRMLGGQERPDSGEIRLDGQSIVGLPPNRIDAATVFQDFALFPHYTVEQNVAFGLRMHGGRDKQAIKKRVAEMLELVGLTGFEARGIAGLSGGEKQRVATARALAVQPRLILMDEPLGALDRIIKLRMQREVSALIREIGLTALYVTHDQREALTMADRVAILHDGVLEQIGTPLEVCHAPRTKFVADFLGAAGNFLPARTEEADAKAITVTTMGASITFPCGNGGSPRKGQSALLVVRPEEIDLTDVDRGQLVGSVQSVAYTGEITEYVVAIEGGRPLLVKGLGRPRHTERDAVGVVVREAALLPVADVA
jgi:ABC-type Fe3+/spermidine/putrescine transport system ATPase subunit